MAGKRQASNDELKARGTFRRSRHGDDHVRGFERDVIVNTADILIPAHIAEDEFALEFWHEIVAELVRLRSITRLDLPALAQLCERHSTWRRAVRTVAADGAFYETQTANGSALLRTHPAVAIGKEAGAQKRVLMESFGMTPSSRARVKPLAVPTEKSEVAEWQALRGGRDGAAS